MTKIYHTLEDGRIVEIRNRMGRELSDPKDGSGKLRRAVALCGAIFVAVLCVLLLSADPPRLSASPLGAPPPTLTVISPTEAHNYQATNTFTGTASAPTIVSFVPTGDMVTGRYLHAATLLADGRVLILGGGGGASTAELYDPTTGTFTATGSMVTGHGRPTATLLADGRVLVTSPAELYDPVTGIFTTTGSMVTERGNHTATLLSDGRVLIAGGGIGATILSSAELYDPTTGTFTATGSMVTERGNHTATLLPDGRVLIACGYNDASNCLTSAELYDPATGTFTTTGSMAMGRCGDPTATPLLDGKVLIAGGRGGWYLYSAELYDPTAGTFTTTGSMAETRSRHTATLLPNGWVLVAGGKNPDTLSSAELYDPATGTFITTNSMTRARYYHTTTLLSNGWVLVAGGYLDADSGLSSAEIATWFPPTVFTGSLTLPADWPVGGTAEVTFSGTNSGAALDAGCLSTASEPCSGWVSAASGVPVTTTWDFGGHGVVKTVYLHLRNVKGQTATVVTGTIDVDTNYGVTINDGALFTSQTAVTLTIGAELGTTQMQVSNDGGFAGAIWEPYASRKAWEITQYGSYVIPRVVYVRYKDYGGDVSATYQDDIILDVTAPTGSVEAVARVSSSSLSAAVVGATAMSAAAVSPTDSYSYTIYLPIVLRGPANVTLYLQAEDDVSGVADMMISHLSSFDCARWEPYATTKAWYAPKEATTVYVKFRDHAGNVSEVVTDTITW